MAIITETKRLIIREMNLDDFESLKKVLSDPINMQYYPKPYDDNGVLRWINWCMNSYKENGFGLWAVVLKETGEMIGDCGISIQNIDNELKPEIGYHLRLDYHKMGLGHEMTKAIKDYFFLRFNYDEVYSYMNINNIPSEKTAIKNGMRFIKTFESDKGEIDKVYRITRKEWELNRNKRIREIYDIVENKLKNHIRNIHNLELPMIMISNQYPGVWLEHLYDSVMYGYLYNDYSIFKNTVINFIKYQNDDGLLPYAIKNIDGPCYWQIQECVSFIHLSYLVYLKTKDNELLKVVYEAGIKWINFLYKYRMTRKLNLVEMFVGYDTGHDNSPRLDGMIYKGNYEINGVKQNAKLLPKSERTPIAALDMSCNLYGGLYYLSKIADILNKKEDIIKYKNLSIDVKKSIFKYLYDKNDNYFYDLDIDNKFNKTKSSSIFHLFLEDVLDIEDDKEMIKNIIDNYIKNKNEFNTNYPFPSISISSNKLNKIDNSWGYYSQALIALRCSIWMDKYNLSDEYNHILEKWIDGLVKNFGINPMSQELDPITGYASDASSWYSSSMLLYIYACRRLEYI